MSRNAIFKKEEILKASFLLFKQKGMGYLKIRNIAKVLNSSTSPIYHHFHSLKEIKVAMEEEVITLFLEPIIHLEDYYTYENLTIAFCLFAKNHKKLFEAIFLKSNQNFENEIRKGVLVRLGEVIAQDKNFDCLRDYYKLVLGDGLALNVFNLDKEMSDEEIKRFVCKFLRDCK